MYKTIGKSVSIKFEEFPTSSNLNDDVSTRITSLETNCMTPCSLCLSPTLNLTQLNSRLSKSHVLLYYSIVLLFLMSASTTPLMYPNCVSLERRKMVLSDGIHYILSNFVNFLRFEINVGLRFSETPCRKSICHEFLPLVMLPLKLLA